MYFSLRPYLSTRVKTVQNQDQETPDSSDYFISRPIHILTIKNNLQLLPGSTWLQKLDNLFAKCSIPTTILSNVINRSNQEINIVFQTRNDKNIVKVLLACHLNYCYPNQIQIA